LGLEVQKSTNKEISPLDIWNTSQEIEKEEKKRQKNT
jgi:hypothetical protein